MSAGVRKLESSRAGVWLRKLVAFPIGERFAVISIAAALFDARVTFVSLLVLGGCAAMYSGGGRVLRSLGRRGHAARFTSAVAGAGAHAVMRDDGPLAQWLGSLVGRRVPIGAVALVALGAAPLLVAASSGDDASWTAATAVVVWAVVVCGVSSGRPLTGRLRWAVIPILRVIEYGSILWLAALAGSAALPAAFAFLCAITFRHYDAYYRWRQRGDPPGRWVVVAALGWDGRLIAVLGMAAAAVAATGLYVAAALLGSLLVGESVASWIAHRRNEDLRPLHDDEDEDAA